MIKNNIDVGVCIVTFNRLDCLKRNIKHILNLGLPDNIHTRIYIVDNSSSDGTKEFLDSLSLKDSKINVKHLKENIGGAGGFATAMKMAFDDRMDYIWGMDDDAYPEKNSLISLLETEDYFGGKAVLWSNCDDDNKGFIELSSGIEVKKVEWLMFVGFFIPYEIIKSVGYPNGNFFIYYDDYEYSRRIINHGNYIYKVKNSIIEHQSSNENTKKCKWLLFSYDYNELPNWKLYYKIRNHVLLCKSNPIEYYFEMRFYHLKYYIKLKQNNPDQISILKLAIMDGTKNKSGKLFDPATNKYNG